MSAIKVAVISIICSGFANIAHAQDTGTIAALVVISSMDSTPTTKQVVPSCKVKNFGNGVYTFDCNENFPLGLSTFIAQHPELEIVAVTQKLFTDPIVVTRKK